MVHPAWLSVTGHQPGAMTSEPMSAEMLLFPWPLWQPPPFTPMCPSNVVIIYVCQERFRKYLGISEVKFSLEIISVQNRTL